MAIDRGPTAVEAIRLLKPDYYVKGQEFEDRPRPPVRLQAEIDAVHEVGGQVRFTHEAVFSSTALLRRMSGQGRRVTRPGTVTRGADGAGLDEDLAEPGHPSACPDDARRFLDGFRTRHSVADVLAGLAALRDLRALVIGEAIIDEYSYCVPLGKSPKEAIVTTRQVRQERHAGGALACANHVAGFCRAVDLVTALGGRGFPGARSSAPICDPT